METTTQLQTTTIIIPEIPLEIKNGNHIAVSVTTAEPLELKNGNHIAVSEVPLELKNGNHIAVSEVPLELNGNHIAVSEVPLELNGNHIAVSEVPLELKNGNHIAISEVPLELKNGNHIAVSGTTIPTQPEVPLELKNGNHIAISEVPLELNGNHIAVSEVPPEIKNGNHIAVSDTTTAAISEVPLEQKNGNHILEEGKKIAVSETTVPTAPEGPSLELKNGNHLSEEESRGRRIIIAVSGTSLTGKSTFCGHLLHNLDLTTVQERKIFEAKNSSEYRYFIHNEKEMGNPHFNGTCFMRHFETLKKSFTLFDCPGKNLNTEAKNASMANVVMIVLSAKENTNLWIHNVLAHSIYSPQYIFLVNQMDTTDPPYSEQAYLDSVKLITKELSDINMNMVLNSPIIPISGRNGDNLTTKSDLMPWWEGYTHKNSRSFYHVKDLLENYIITPKHCIDGETRISVYREFPKIKILGVYMISGSGITNDKLYHSKGMTEYTLQSLRRNEKDTNQLPAGDHGCTSISNYGAVKLGSLLLTKHDIISKYKQTSFIADITNYHHSPLKVGSSGIISTQALNLEIKLTQFLSKQEIPAVITEENPIKIIPDPKEILPKERARVIGNASKDFLFDLENNCPYLGRITCFMGGKVGFNGKIMDVILSDGKKLSEYHKWARVRLLLIGCYKDRQARFPCPREIVLRIAYYLWKLDYVEKFE